jgi:hypothetical protein
MEAVGQLTGGIGMARRRVAGGGHAEVALSYLRPAELWRNTPGTRTCSSPVLVGPVGTPLRST